MFALYCDGRNPMTRERPTVDMPRKRAVRHLEHANNPQRHMDTIQRLKARQNSV